MATAKPLPPALSTASFTIGEARLHGLPPGRIKAQDLHVPSRGIRVPANQGQSLLARARPYTQLGPPDVVSFYSAAQIHAFRMPLPSGSSLPPSARLLHLTRNGSSAPRRKGVIGHRAALDPGDIVQRAGVPVTSEARTLLDLAGTGHLTLEDLVVIADGLVCEHPRWQHAATAQLPLAELRGYLARQRCVAGLPLLRKALALVRAGVDSAPETRLRLLFGRSGLPPFEPDVVLIDAQGMPLWADLGCPEYRLAVEYDGGHHLTPAQRQADAIRAERTMSAGWRQLVLNNVDVTTGEAWVLVRVRQALRAQGWSG
ncbi:endonuclease domain-containing protein [Arthrobacter sp. LAR12-1-1.1]|uniref:endonuclease domain-containing protein n=1 Tax=Arthrobacter sp. LAR12-1-1.1 TaxID=3135215 RepID=UPI003429EA44